MGDFVEFCQSWDAALTSGDDEGISAVLAEAPAEIAAQASIMVDAAESDGDDAEAEGREVLAWIELNCDLNAASETGDAGDRRIAPRFDATPVGFEICLAGGMFSIPASDDVGAVIYGDMTVDDPYTGEMLGVLWGTEGGHGGDGDRTPVTVSGVEGVAAPITVFQQAILEDLGTVIAWQQEGYSIGLYGRGFDQSRVAELLEFAEALALRDGVFELAPDSLPAGFGEIYRGSSDALSLVIPIGDSYRISYRDLDAGGLLTVSGQEMSADEFELIRFLTVGLDREDFDGRDAIVGNAWNADGPAVIAWREPDGLAVRFVGLGTDLETVRETARSAQELSRSQWAEIVNGTSDCNEGSP